MKPKELIFNCLETGLFTLHDLDTIAYWIALKNTNFVMSINHNGKAKVWLKEQLEIGCRKRTVVSFEQVLESVSDDLKEQLLFHLDLCV